MPVSSNAVGSAVDLGNGAPSGDSSVTLVGSALAIGNGTPAVDSIDLRSPGQIYSGSLNLYYDITGVLDGIPVIYPMPGRRFHLTAIMSAGAGISAGTIDYTLDDVSVAANTETATWYEAVTFSAGNIKSLTIDSPIRGIRFTSDGDDSSAWIAIQEVK